MSDKTVTLLAIPIIASMIFSLVGNVIWGIGNNAIKGPDMPSHLLFSLEYYYRFQDIVHNPALPIWSKARYLFSLLTESMPHAAANCPNLGYALTHPFYVFFGPSLPVARMSNMLCLAAMLVSVYITGKHLSSRFGGLLSAYFLLMSPLIYESSRQYGLDFPLTAFVSVSMALLLKCDGFNNLKYTLLAALCAGLGTLVKGQLAIFLLVPILLLLARGAFSNAQYAVLFAACAVGGALLDQFWPFCAMGIASALVIVGKKLIAPREATPSAGGRALIPWRNFSLFAAICLALASLWWCSHFPFFTMNGFSFRVDNLNIPSFRTALSAASAKNGILCEAFGLKPADVSRLPEARLSHILKNALLDPDFCARIRAREGRLPEETRELLRNFQTRPAHLGISGIEDIMLQNSASFEEAVKRNCALLKTLYPPELKDLRVLTTFCRGFFTPVSYPLRTFFLLKNMVRGLGPPLFLIFAAGLLGFLTADIPQKEVYIAWLAIPVVFMIKGFGIFELRHLMPIFPMIAIIAAQGILRIASAKGRIVILLALAGHLLLQYSVMTFAGETLQDRLSRHFLLGRTDYGAAPERQDRLRIDELVRSIPRASPPPSKVLLVSLAYPQLDPMEIRYRCKAKDKDIDVQDFCLMSYMADAEFDSFDHIIFKCPLPEAGEWWPPRKDISRLLRDNTQSFIYAYFSRTGLEEGLVRKLYARRKNFHFTKAIRSDQGFFWAVYSRQS